MSELYSAFVVSHPFIVGGVFLGVCLIVKYGGDWIKQIIEGGN